MLNELFANRLFALMVITLVYFAIMRLSIMVNTTDAEMRLKLIREYYDGLIDWKAVPKSLNQLLFVHPEFTLRNHVYLDSQKFFKMSWSATKLAYELYLCVAAILLLLQVSIPFFYGGAMGFMCFALYAFTYTGRNTYFDWFIRNELTYLDRYILKGKRRIQS